MPYKIKRNSEGLLTENCPINIGVKIGSFDCTATCKHNQNTSHEIYIHGFEIPEIKCDQADKLPSQNNQLTIEI